MFQHACKMGLGGDRLEAAGIALSIWTFAGLAQVQESGGSGGEALLRPEPTDLYSGRLAAEVQNPDAGTLAATGAALVQASQQGQLAGRGLGCIRNDDGRF